MPEQNEEQKNAILTILCQYLLFERKQETQLSIAYALLIQERHNQYHTLGGHKEGDDSSFGECGNEKCVAAFNILKDSRSMAIEVNDITIQMIADFTLTVKNEGRTCRAFLTPKLVASSPSIIIPGEGNAD